MALTPQKARFVQEYLVDLNATQAALRAGYSPKTAYSQGARLLKDVEVAKAIAAAQGERAERAKKSADDVIAELEAIGFMELEAPEAPGVIPFWRPEHKLTALKQLAMHHGLLKQKVEHTGEGGGSLVIEIRKYGEDEK
jgi:phage terminase small subunit